MLANRTLGASVNGSTTPAATHVQQVTNTDLYFETLEPLKRNGNWMYLPL